MTSTTDATTTAIATMRGHLERMTNAQLADQRRALVKLIAAAPADPTVGALEVGLAVVVDVLAERNTHLEQALDAWAADPDNGGDYDEIIERHVANMDPASTFHIAHPMDLDPLAGLD